MSTHKKPNELRVAPSNAAADLDALSKSLGYAPALPIAQVSLLRKRGGAVPVKVINLLANLAEQNGGAVAGLPFDSAAARDALARAENAQQIAKAARRLSRRAISDSVHSLALVGDESMTLVVALGRKVRTPNGKSFVEANDEIKSLMRAHSKSGRTRKAAAKATTPVATSTTTTVVAPVNTSPTTSTVVAPVNAPGTPSNAPHS
jgi:hypothetical protein